MKLCSILTGELILFAACVICGNVAPSPCTIDGWFGPNCQYQCHCVNSAPCDKSDGSCSSGCCSDWFGPACQYALATFTASGLGWLTDSSDTTCNTGSSQSVTVDLDTAIPLTWVRVVLNDAAYLNQIELSYKLTTSPSFQSCINLKTAKVDEVTFDIYCPTDTTVNQIALSGSGVIKLCALYISGGRNVALKQPTQQSTRYDAPNVPGNNFFLAQYAVDGRVGDGSIDSVRLTCTHTDVDPSPDWWTVNFTQAVDIIGFLIYNRNDANTNTRLIGFTITVQPESIQTATPYTYTDTQGVQIAYPVVPSSKLSFPVRQVKVEAGPTSTILTLCEVYVFGEFQCPSGTFGLSCERQCNCAGGGRTCFIHSGGCPDDCATNYGGEDCYDCAAGKYGANCNLNCSVHCGGDNSCDRNTGVCSHGCGPGYTGDQCMSICEPGKYGDGCAESCSVHCAGQGDPCNNTFGYCTQGCDPGYYWRKCTQVCSVGYYGAGCNTRCSSNCGGSDNACHHVTGVCDICSSGKYGFNCLSSCSVNCAGHDNVCDRDTGDCECDARHWGHKCLNDCNETCAGQDHACYKVSGDCMSCYPGFYGKDCLSECSVNCGGSNSTCNITNGDCDEGCDPGYHGARCNEVCPRGNYGINCEKTCSDHCAGLDNACSNVDGACDQGCDLGYLPPLCDQKCPRGRYGPQCSQKCSVFCAGPTRECDFKTGICYQGCVVGFQPPTCHNECPTGSYGQDCEMTCSVQCAGSGVDCNKTDGACDMGCKPGFHGRFCSEVCLRGKYGPGCLHNCSAQCAGQDRPCHHVDGVCYFGCVEEDQSLICRGPGALHQSEEAGESGLNIWGISVTIVAAAAAVIVMGLLVWRLLKCNEERSATSTNNGIVEEGSQRSGLLGIPNENSPNQRYHSVHVSPEDVNLYNEGFDHYDIPLDLVRSNGDYETPQPIVITNSNQDYVDFDNVSSVEQTAERSGYVNAL